MFNKYSTTPLTGFGPDPRSFWDMTPLLRTQAMWQQNIIDANKRYDNTIAEISKSTDPANLLKNLNSSNLSSSARKQADSIGDYTKKLEEQRKRTEKEEKERLEKKRKEDEERHKRLLGDTKKTEQDIIKLENARVSAIKKVDREIETIEKRLEKTRGEVENINPNKVFSLTNGESIITGVDKKEEERFKNKTAQIERDEKTLEEKLKWREFVYSDDFTGKYIEDRNINYQNFLKKLGINNTSSPASQQEEMPEEIKEVINGTSQNGTTETKQKSNGKKEKPQSENVYDLTTEEGKKRALEDRKKEPKKQPSKLTEYEETHRDLVERSKADPNGVYILDINNPNFLTGGKKQHQAGDRLASNRIKDLPDGTVIAYKGSVRRITTGDKVYGLDSITPKYDTPYEANVGEVRSQKAQQDEIINSLPAITKQVEVDDKGYIIPEGDVRSGTGTITEVEDSLSNYADIGSKEWEEMGDVERKDKAQEFLNYYGKRLLEAQKENPEVFTNEKIKQLLAEKKSQFDENIRLYLKENSDNLAEDVGNLSRDLAISTINFFDEGMAGIADFFGMNTLAEFFYRGGEDISKFKSKEQQRKDKNYQYLKAKYEKQFGNGLIDSAKAAILAADESDNLINTLRDSLIPSLLFMGGGAGALSKGSGFVAKNAAKISTVGIMGASGAGSAGGEVRTIKDRALSDENYFNNFLEAYKKKNGEKAYNALIESASKNGKLDKEELFNILQSKAARIGGGLSATVGLISSSLGGDVETGLINRFVLGNAAARGAVGKLTALKLAGNIASSMANEGAEEAAETMSQNIALSQTADPEREITEGVGEAAALGMAGGVIGGSLEYMGDRSANRNQQQNQQIQNQNQQTDEFEVEDNPPQLTEREQEEEKKEERLRKQYKRLFEPKGSFEEWLKDAEETIDTERQVKAMVDNLTDAQVREEIQWLFDNYIDNEEVLGHLSEDERKQFNEMLKTQFGLNTNHFAVVSEPTEAEKFWTTNENQSGVSPDIINAMAVDDGVAQNLNINADDEAYFQHMANVLNNTLVNNEEWNKATNTNERRAVLQKALDAELKDAQDIDENKKNEIRLILSGELLANGAREFDKQTEQEETPKQTKPADKKYKITDNDVKFIIASEDKVKNYIPNKENIFDYSKRYAEKHGLYNLHLHLQELFDFNKKRITSKNFTGEGYQTLDTSGKPYDVLPSELQETEQSQQTEQTQQQTEQQQQQEETPKQEKSNGRKQKKQPQSDTISIDIEDTITFDGVPLRRAGEIRRTVNSISINADEIQNRLDAGETRQNIVDDLLNSLNLTDKDEINFARDLLDRKVQDVLPKKKSGGKKQETKQEKSDGVKQTDGEFTAEDVANLSSPALDAYRQSGLPKAGKAIKDNIIAKYLNMSDEEVSAKLNKQYGKKRGAERKALLDQIKEEIRSKKNGQQTNATENTGQSEETSGERTGEEEQRGSGLVNDEQGTTGDASAESIGDTSQGQGSTESNQTDTSTETANSTGGATDQTGQGENTLNEGTSSEVENDNRQAESEGDIDKKSKGRKSTKSTNTKSEKNTTGGRKPRTEETERNTNDRGGETVAEEGVKETFNPQNVIEKTSPNLADYQKENLLTYFNIVNNNKELANYLAEVLVDDVKNNNSETAKQIYRKVINQLPNTFVDEDRIRAFKAGYGIPARSDGIQGLVVANKDNSESEAYKTWKSLVNDELSKNPNETPIKILENVATRILNNNTTPTAEKTARQQLNDLGFTDNEIHNLTADLTGTLNEDEVKKAARKKGIRSNKKLDEVIELFNQDIRDRIDDGEIKFNLDNQQEIQNENDATLRNDEQQGDLGGNQSAETRGANDNQENSTQYNDTTPNEPTRNGNGKTRQRKAQKQKIIKSITGFNGEINDSQSTADPAELKASIENELRNTFGEETAGQVQVMTLDELRKTQPKTADSVEKYNVRGFYKPKSGQVVIIADHFAGLSPKEASLVAFHELGHKTMGAKRAEWDNELARLSSNKTISKIKDKLKQIEGYKNLNDIELTEEVMADLFAAHQSGDWNSFTDKYGVEFSKELTGETRTLYERFKDFIKNFFGYGENDQVSDREVRAALGKLSLEFNGETEADLNSQEKSIADVNSYIEKVRNGQMQDERISALVEQGLSDEDIVKDLFGELADADAEGKTYKTNLPENISNAIQNAWNGIKNTVSTVALGSSIWVGTNLGMSQEAMAQDFNYSNPAEFESQVVKKIVDTNDHLGETFAVVNKQNGSLTIYDRSGNQIATTPALYGKKVGDTFNSTSSGTTPSGRFNLEYTTNINNKDYGKSVQILTQNGEWLRNSVGNFAIHRTYTGFPNENRPARLASKTPADNKISLGCINIPPAFYDAHFENNQFGNMPLYVLPETPAGRTGIFSNQPSQNPATPSGKGDPEIEEILRKYNVKNKGNPAKNKPYTNDYMENINPFATAQAVSNGEVKNAELEGLASTYKELNQINIGDSIAQDQTDRQDVLTTGFKDGLSSASMVTYNYGSEPDFNEEIEDDPRLTPSERLANGYFDSMPIQRGVREDSTEDDDIYKAAIGIVGGLEIALATKGVVNAVKTTNKRKSTGAKKLLPSQAPNQQYIDKRRKAWQNHIRKVSNDIDPETIDKETGVGKAWTQARLDEIADLYFNIDDFNDSLFDASSYIQSRTSDFDNHRTWGNNRLLRWVFKTFGGATPAFDNALGRQNIKRFGYEADSAIPSVHFARIKALTNGAMGHLQRSYLRPLHRQTEYLAQDLGKSTKQIRQDAGELATIDHILDEGADHFFRGLDIAIQEAKGKYGNLLLALQAAASAGNIRQYDKIDAQMKQLNEEIRKARIERVRSYRVYKGKDPDNGQTLLPGGFTEQMLNDKRTELQNNYGNDFSRLKKHSDEIVDITQKVRNFGATNGVFGADSLNTIQKLGFTNYVPLYTNPTENENLELDFDKSPFELLNELTQRTTNDILNLGVSSNALKNILGNGTTRDFTSFGRNGSTSEKQALNAYENLETFAQKIAARTGTIPFAQSVQQLFEGTVGESMQTVNKNLNFAEFNSKPKLDANGNPMFDANGNPVMENMTMRGGNSKFKGLIRFPSDMSNDWKQPLTREEIRQLEQDLGMQPGKLGTPSQLKSRLASLQPIRAKGYNADGELKNYDYYFIEPDVSKEINQSFNHLARTRLTDGRGFISDIMGAGTKLESKLMTSYNLVWNGVNFMRDSLERWSIMINRPVKDMNGNLVSKWDLTKTYENNIAKLIGSPTEAMPEIYRYLTENEVKTELQRQLQEAVRGGGIQLMNDLLRKDSSILLDNKNEVIEKVLKHMEHWTNTGVNKIGGGGIRNTLKEVNASYITAFVEIPQVISALAAYQTYQQLGVNKQESLNRTRDMFDPLRTRNNLVSGASKFYPFVRATLSGHYNLIRTLTQYWKPGERGWMTGYLLGGTATAYAFYALAAGFMGDDDDGIPKIAKMSIQQLMQGIPIPAYKKGFFSIPTGFGINKIFSSLAAILFKYNHGQLSRGDAFKASLDLIFENTTPLKPVHSRDNSILKSIGLTFAPYLFKTAFESSFGQRSNGSTLYKVQKKLGQKHHQIDDFTVPDKYKSLAKTLHDWSGGFLDFNPETLELFADNVFQGPLKVIPQNLMQDRAEKTLGHETSKGEFIGLALNLIGAGILSSPTAFEDYNFIHAFQRQRVGILETFNIDETGKTMMDENGTLITDAKAMGLDATQNVARRLAAKGASREVINFVVNNRNFTKIRNDLQRDLRHYLNIHNRHTDPKVRAMAKEQAEDLWNRIEGLQKFYIKNEGRSWYELLQEFNEGGLSREVLQSPY